MNFSNILGLNNQSSSSSATKARPSGISNRQHSSSYRSSVVQLRQEQPFEIANLENQQSRAARSSVKTLKKSTGQSTNDLLINDNQRQNQYQQNMRPSLLASRMQGDDCTPPNQSFNREYDPQTVHTEETKYQMNTGNVVEANQAQRQEDNNNGSDFGFSSMFTKVLNFVMKDDQEQQENESTKRAETQNPNQQSSLMQSPVASNRYLQNGPDRMYSANVKQSNSNYKENYIRSADVNRIQQPNFNKTSSGAFDLNQIKNTVKDLGEEVRKSMISAANSNFSTKTNSISPNVQQQRSQKLEGLSPQSALELYEDELTPLEYDEVRTFGQNIYTIGSVRINSLRSVSNKDGFYKVQVGEQIGFRYIIDKIVDNGAFGQVVRAIDMREAGKEVAIKISRNSKFDVDNAKVEVRILQKLAEGDPYDRYHLVRMIENFTFRGHVVITFEMLGINLFKYIHLSSFKGMKTEQLRNICTQVLQALQHLKQCQVIHCDLKPENILFVDQQDKQVSQQQYQKIKLIDFGSSCTNYRNGYTYVQSRFYRCPEIVLGIQYDHAVDMWSFGCIVAELVTGRPLFPAIDQNELLELQRLILGDMPRHMISQGKYRNKFYDAINNLKRSRNSRIGPVPACSFPLGEALYNHTDNQFVDFLAKCLEYDPKKRMTPEEGLQHPWIRRGKHSSMLHNLTTTNSNSKVKGMEDLSDLLKPLSMAKKNKQPNSQLPPPKNNNNDNQNLL